MRVFRVTLVVGLLAAPLFARQPVHARHAMVVTRESNATDVGLQVLQAGGNAVDAAVAVGFALAVTLPSAGNLGGGGFMLVRMADGTSSFIDFRERAPLSATRDMYLDSATGVGNKDSLQGYRASGVPGTVRGLELAHAKYGKKAWRDLVQAAVGLAADGFPVSWGLARFLQVPETSDKLGQYAESKRIFLKDGAYYEAGETLKQPELARTLGRIRDQGAKDFYEGETARMLAADMAAHGGAVTLEDLKAYKAIERRPLEGSYKGYGVLTAPPPSSGGIGVLQMLGLLAAVEYPKGAAGSATAIHYEVEAMRRYFADRAEFLGDTDFVKAPVKGLLQPDYIRSRAQTIQAAKATPSSEIRQGDPGPYESPQTTHYSIIDEAGNAVAVTYTLNESYGSGVTPAGLGFLLNNTMDDFAAAPGKANRYGLIQGENNAIAPRKTPLSAMTPTIVTKEGKLYMVLGSPGGPTIINSVLQVFLNVIDFGMNMQEAVDQPRVHHQWMPDSISVEKTVSPDTVALLLQFGHTVKTVNAIGEVAAIRVFGGWLEGAPDGRTEATAKGY